MSEARIAIRYVAPEVCPLGMKGCPTDFDHQPMPSVHAPKSNNGYKLTKTDASTILRPAVPFTVKSGFTTPPPVAFALRFAGPIAAEPTTCERLIAVFLANCSSSSSVVALAAEPKGEIM